ncbi:hypothetical protein [Actinoplanes sp. NPDC049599]|uniref:hypothetical protein n=1 Tax=Actinoplanes sp. NPDC049599 TaxID=3363903 RepID=UPI003792FEDC
MILPDGHPRAAAMVGAFLLDGRTAANVVAGGAVVPAGTAYAENRLRGPAPTPGRDAGSPVSGEPAPPVRHRAG